VQNTKVEVFIKHSFVSCFKSGTTLNCFLLSAAHTYSLDRAAESTADHNNIEIKHNYHANKVYAGVQITFSGT